MTTANWFQDLIDAEWGVNALGTEDLGTKQLGGSEKLPIDAPQPNTVVGGSSAERRRSVQADEPYIFITDGGNPIVEPRSVGYREEHVETILSVDIETNEDREALVGTVTDDYGGLAGEVKRICDKYRRGVDDDAPVPQASYDLIRFDTFENEVEQRGADRWGGVWTVRFVTFASSISQTPVR